MNKNNNYGQYGMNYKNIISSSTKQQKKSNHTFSFLYKYFETILEIIEDKPNFLIPVFFYCFLITIFFLQIAGYILSNFEAKKLYDPKISYLAHINEVSTLTFLLFMKGNDQLTLIAYFFMQACMYFYFTYVAVITYIKNYRHYQYLQHKTTFRRINQGLNVFFTFYWWLFFTPYIEINSGMMVCGQQSFLSSYRVNTNDEQNSNVCSNFPKWQIAMGSVGLFLSVCTGLIIIYFFRNYEFDEQNLVKRRFNFLLCLQLISRFAMTLFYYLTLSFVPVFKHILAQLLGMSFLYDFYFNWPFKDKAVAFFYGAAAIIFQVTMINCTLWIFVEGSIQENELFFQILMISTLFTVAFRALWYLKYEQIMRMNPSNFKHLFPYFDFYLEEIIRLAMTITKDESSKYKLFEVIIHHQETCTNQLCFCKSDQQLGSNLQAQTTGSQYSKKRKQLSQTQSKAQFRKRQNKNDQQSWKQTSTQKQQLSLFVDECSQLKPEAIFQLVDSLFQWALKQPILTVHNPTDFEHLSLKYISYLAKYRNNTYRAYFELKSLIAKRNNPSYYFSEISKILSQNIERQMEQDCLRHGSTYQNEQQKNKATTATNQSDQSQNQGLSEDKSNNQSKENEKVVYQKKLGGGGGGVVGGPGEALGNSSNNVNEELNINSIWNLQKITMNFLPLFAGILDLKIKFWERLKRGFNQMSEFHTYALEFMEQYSKVRDGFQTDFWRATSNQDKNCIYFSKMQAIFQAVILNDMLKTYKLELLVGEYRKRDAFKPQGMLQNVNIMRRNIISFVVSIAQERGKIISQKTARMAHFFGFRDLKEFSSAAGNIRFLMPEFIAELHDLFITRLIDYGQSTMIKSNRLVFFQNRARFIHPAKLYLEHSFGYYDDFCLLATMLQLEHQGDYIAFNKQGRIVGITSNIFKKIFRQETIDPNFLYKYGYIFLIFKDIIQLIRESKERIILFEQGKSQENLLFSNNKAVISLNIIFKDIFQQFDRYMLSGNHTQQFAKSQQGLDQQQQHSTSIINNLTEVMPGQPPGSQQQKLQQQPNDLSSSSYGGPRYYTHQDLNILNMEITNRILQFYTNQMNSSRALHTIIQRGQTKFQSSSSKESISQQKTDSSYLQMSLFFKFSLFCECYRYNKGADSTTIFFLQLTDLYQSKKKLKILDFSSKAALTYLNTTIIGQQMTQFYSNTNNSSSIKKMKSNVQLVDKTEIKLSNFYNQDPNIKEAILCQSPMPINLVGINNDQNVVEYNQQSQQNKQQQQSHETDNNTRIPDYGKASNTATVPGVNAVFQLQQLQQSFQEDQQSFMQMLPDQSMTKDRDDNNSFRNGEDQQFISSQRKFLSGGQLLFTDRPEFQKADLKEVDPQGDSSIIAPPSIINNQNYKNQIKELDEFQEEDNIQSLQDEQELGKRSKIKQSNIDKQKDNATNANKMLTSQQSLNNAQQLYPDILNQSINNDNQYKNDLNNKKEMDIVAASSQFAVDIEKSENNNNDNNKDEVMKIEEQNNSKDDNQEDIDQELEEIKRKKEKRHKEKNMQNKNKNGKIEDNQEVWQRKRNSKKLNSIKKQNQMQKDDGKVNAKISEDEDDELNDENELDDEELENNLFQLGDLDRGEVQQSLNSASSRSFISQGSSFVREILDNHRLPRAATSYKVLVALFILVFLILILINVFIFSSEILKLSNYIEFINLPQELVNQYCKGLQGAIGKYEISMNLYNQNDNNNGVNNDKLNKTNDSTNLDESIVNAQFQMYTQAAYNYFMDLMKINTEYIATIFSSDTIFPIQSIHFQVDEIQSLPLLQICNLIQECLYQATALISKFQSNQQDNNTNNDNSFDFSLKFLMANFHQVNDIIERMIDESLNRIYDTIDNINELYIISTAVAISVTFVVIMANIPFILKISKYEEKILMLVARITEFEADFEVKRLRYQQEILNDSNELWLKIDMVRLMQVKLSDTGRAANNVNQLANKQTHIISPQPSANRDNLIINSNMERGNEDQSKRPLTPNALEIPKTGRATGRQLGPGSSSRSGGVGETQFKKNTRSNVLASKIFDQKISVRGRIAGLLIWGLLQSLFFVIALVVIISKNQNLTPLLDTNKYSIKTHFSLGKTITILETLIYSRAAILHSLQTDLQSNQTIFTLEQLFYQGFSYYKWQEYINTELNSLLESSKLNINQIYSDTALTSQVIKQLETLFQHNLCQGLIEDNSNNQYCSEVQQQIYDEGIIGVISQLKKLLIQYDKLFFQDYDSIIIMQQAQVDGNITEIKRFLQSSEHKLYIIDHFLIVDKAMQKFTDLIMSANKQTIEDIQTFAISYFLAFGLILFLIWSLIGWYSWRLMKSRFEMMNSLLTIIPIDKLNEEITLHMLKTIRNF